MSAVTLTLKINPNTHERTLEIHYESDDDYLPFEHEHEHLQWVESLLGHPLQHIAEKFEIKRKPSQRIQNTYTTSPLNSTEEGNLLRKPTEA